MAPYRKHLDRRLAPDRIRDAIFRDVHDREIPLTLLSHATGLTIPQLSRWRMGKTHLTCQSASKIMVALGLVIVREP